jgi:pyrroline-5-carboxylate reductase
MAGTGLDRLRAVIGPARGTIGMMPGYANAYRLGPSILCPDDDFWRGVLAHIGPVHVLEDEKLFTAAATFGAFSGATVGWMAHIIGWYQAQGLDHDTARALVAGTLRGNAEVLLSEPTAAQRNRRRASPRRGASPCSCWISLINAGALTAWDTGLDAVPCPYQRHLRLEPEWFLTPRHLHCPRPG